LPGNRYSSPTGEAVGGYLPGGRGAAGSPLYIKGLSSPSPFIFFPRHPERGRERGGVREGVAVAKSCRILDPNRR